MSEITATDDRARIVLADIERIGEAINRYRAPHDAAYLSCGCALIGTTPDGRRITFARNISTVDEALSLAHIAHNNAELSHLDLIPEAF